MGWFKKPDAEKATKEDLSHQQVLCCTMTRIPSKDVPLPLMTKNMSVLVVENVLDLRRRIPLTLYKVEAWNMLLCQHGQHTYKIPDTHQVFAKWI